MNNHSLNGSANLVDIAIFGAGPAGLSAGALALYLGRRIALLESGKGVDFRKHDLPVDLVTGVGGAGLYSDGKLSFYPSATALWKLADQTALIDSYRRLRNVLSDNIEIPDFPQTTQNKKPADSPFSLKEYPSFYIDFDSRLRLIHRLSDHLSKVLIPKATVTSIKPGEKYTQIKYLIENQIHEVYSKATVLACGRFGSATLPKICPDIPMLFRRFELGIRIESDAETFFLKDHSCLDPKYIFKNDIPDVEWRTFCTCRNGEVIKTNFMGINSYSGRSDHIKTNKSNVGFNVRWKSEKIEESLLSELLDCINGKVSPFKVDITEFLSDNRVFFGKHIDSVIKNGLRTLANEFSIMKADIYGPCIEGVGYYPEIDENLKVRNLPIWIAGDQTGIFRGLTASLLSGHYAAQKAHEFLASKERTITSTSAS